MIDGLFLCLAKTLKRENGLLGAKRASLFTSYRDRLRHGLEKSVPCMMRLMRDAAFGSMHLLI